MDHLMLPSSSIDETWKDPVMCCGGRGLVAYGERW